MFLIQWLHATSMARVIQSGKSLSKRHCPLCQPLPGPVIASADNSRIAIHAHGKGYQYIGIVGMVLQAQPISAQSRTPMNTGVPGRHQIHVRHGMAT